MAEWWSPKPLIRVRLSAPLPWEKYMTIRLLAKNLESSKTSVEDLILFCIHSVISNNEQCSFERLVKECFTLFPETLKFTRYPVWPDSRKLDRPLRALRNEKLIIGDPKTYFILT